MTDRGAEHGQELGAGQLRQLRQAHTQARVRPHYAGHRHAIKPEEKKSLKRKGKNMIMTVS